VSANKIKRFVIIEGEWVFHTLCSWMHDDTVCFTDLDQGSEMIIFEAILATLSFKRPMGQLQKLALA
jgi:hypothetical protein